MDGGKHRLRGIAKRSEEEPGGAPGRGWVKRVALIWTGQALSYLSTQAATFAVMWHLTGETGSPAVLAAAGVAGLLPTALLSPFGGVAADRFPRRRVIVGADGLAGLLSLLLALCFLGGAATVPVVVLALGARASAAAFHGPALSALMPQLVPGERIMAVNALDQMLIGGAGIIGPVLGALLFGMLGPGGALALDALCAAAACLFLLIAQVPEGERNGRGSAGRDASSALLAGAGGRSEGSEPAGGFGAPLGSTAPANGVGEPSGSAASANGIVGSLGGAAEEPGVAGVLHDVREGFRCVWGERGIRALMAVEMLGLALLMPLASLEPLMVAGPLGGDAWAASAVEACFGFGALAGSGMAMAASGVRGKTRLLVGAGMAMGTAVIGCGLMPAAGSAGLVGFALLFGVAGAAMGLYAAPVLSLVQARIPADRLGRAMGIYSAGALLASPVGLALSGPLADALGLGAWFIACGASLIALHAAAFACRPLRALDAPDGR